MWAHYSKTLGADVPVGMAAAMSGVLFNTAHAGLFQAFMAGSLYEIGRLNGLASVGDVPDLGRVLIVSEFGRSTPGPTVKTQLMYEVSVALTRWSRYVPASPNRVRLETGDVPRQPAGVGWVPPPIAYGALGVVLLGITAGLTYIVNRVIEKSTYLAGIEATAKVSENRVAQAMAIASEESAKHSAAEVIAGKELPASPGLEIALENLRATNATANRVVQQMAPPPPPPPAPASAGGVDSFFGGGGGGGAKNWVTLLAVGAVIGIVLKRW